MRHKLCQLRFLWTTLQALAQVINAYHSIDTLCHYLHTSAQNACAYACACKCFSVKMMGSHC